MKDKQVDQEEIQSKEGGGAKLEKGGASRRKFLGNMGTATLAAGVLGTASRGPHGSEVGRGAEPRGCLLRLKPGRALVLSPRRSIEWVRNIDGRQDKTAPGDPVELHELVPGVRSRRGNSYAYLGGQCQPRRHRRND